MTDEEILSHSYPYLHALYKEYPNRACENLGVSSDPEEREKTKSKSNKNKSKSSGKRKKVTFRDEDYPIALSNDPNASKQFNGTV